MAANSKKFKSMSKEERFIFMATGKVSTSAIWQLDETTHKLNRFFVAKVRGITVSDGETWRHETEEQARQFGEKILSGWKQELLSRVAA